MKVALFSDTFPPEINGVATATNTLFQALKAQGHTVYVVTTNPYSNQTTFHNNILRVPGITLKRIYNYKLAGFINLKARKVIKKMNLDLIHVQTEAGIGIMGRLIASKYHIPLVYTYHTMYYDYTYYVTKGAFDQTAKSLVKKFSKIMCDTSAEFTTPSYKTKDSLRSYGVNKYINVVPNGIDLSRFEEDRIDKNFIADFKQKYNLENKYILLSLGRVAKEKSIDVIINGYSEYLKTNPSLDTVLLIVGDGPCREELEQQCKNLNIEKNCIFVGKVPYEQVPFFYYMADLYLAASITETQGLTFIESIASKTLVLCRFDENLQEVIEDGKTGFFFKDNKTFVEKLLFIMNMKEEDRKKIIEYAYERNKRYSMETFASRMEEVYNRALKKFW